MTKQKKPLTEAQLGQRRAAGRALVAKYSPEHMRIIGKSGYFNAGAKYGFEYVNQKIFGVHLSTAKAKKLLLSDHAQTQLRFFLPAPSNEKT